MIFNNSLVPTYYNFEYIVIQFRIIIDNYHYG